MFAGVMVAVLLAAGLAQPPHTADARLGVSVTVRRLCRVQAAATVAIQCARMVPAEQPRARVSRLRHRQRFESARVYDVVTINF